MRWPPTAAPALTPATRRLLAAAAERDRRLRAEIGMDYTEFRTAVAALDPGEGQAVLLDGYRWRHYWQPGQLARRVELEAAERRRLTVQSSHAIAELLGHAGPSHLELQRRRYPPDGDVRRWVAEGDPEGEKGVIR